MKNYQELVVVMGGGVLEDGQLPSHVLDRCKYVISLPKNLSRLVVASSSFTLNVPPKRTIDGFLISEASSIYRWLTEHNYLGDILCEQASHDTVGSIFYTLLFYAELLDIRKISYITSDFHAERVDHISNRLNNYFGNKFTISTVSCDSILNNQQRNTREKKSLEFFLKEYANIKSKKEFLLYLHKNHRNYNENFRGDSLNEINLGY